MERTLFFFFFGILILPEVYSTGIKLKDGKGFGKIQLGEGVKLESRAACPSGWTVMNSSCYLMPNINLPFNDAKTYCQNVTTGELVTIYSANEYQAVMSFTNSHSSGGLYPFWIGLVPDFWSPYWAWGDGTYLNYTKWYNNTRPNDNNGANCVAWRTVAGDDGWVPVACKYAQPFICKQPARICPTVTVNGTVGNVTSPGYPGPYPLDINCKYILTVPDGNVVQMHFDAFELDYNDYITLYDGSDIGGTADKMGSIMDDFIGMIFLYYFETTRSSMGMEFVTSDMSLFGPGEGFVAHFNARPTPTPISLNPTMGTLASPNYPNNYNDTLELLYVINSPPGTVIEFEIIDFATEPSYDWLRISDGPSVNNATLLDWSGNHVADCPKVLKTSSNAAFLVFYADEVYEAKGFNLTYRSVPS